MSFTEKHTHTYRDKYPPSKQDVDIDNNHYYKLNGITSPSSNLSSPASH